MLHEFVQLRREAPRNDSSLRLVVVYLDGPEGGKYMGSGKWHVTSLDATGLRNPSVSLRVGIEGNEEHVWLDGGEGGEHRLSDSELAEYRFHFGPVLRGVGELIEE